MFDGPQQAIRCGMAVRDAVRALGIEVRRLKGWCQTSAVTSERSPLVLLHSATTSGRIWQDIVPLVSEHHDVHAPTLLGHCGGPAMQRRPAGISDMVDAAENYLDENGLARCSCPVSDTLRWSTPLAWWPVPSWP